MPLNNGSSHVVKQSPSIDKFIICHVGWYNNIIIKRDCENHVLQKVRKLTPTGNFSHLAKLADKVVGSVLQKYSRCLKSALL